jgi:hypothetical protein
VVRLLPKVSAATALVAVLPLLAVWGLGRLGVIASPVLAAGLGAALSLTVYHLAASFWQRRADAADVLFGDLMLWGWVRRCVQQRRIADAAALLGAGRGMAGRDPMQLSPARRVQLLEQLASDLEARDAYTLGHSRRVARYSALIAKRMGVPKDELSRIRTAATVHDIGKLQTPLDVLRKPGALTDAEFALVKRHPSDGAQMVAILEDDALTETVLRHHERLDGSGYPGGLRGSEVSLGARIVAVADTFDAITSSRSYRAARPHKQALDILRAEAGTRLDADAVDAFLSAYLGRRPFGAWIAFTDLAERLLVWLAGDAVGTGSRLAAIAAGTVAVGSGAVVLPTSTHRPGRAPASRLTLSRDRVAPTGRISAGVFATRPLRPGAAGAPVARTGAGNSLRFQAAPGKGHAAPSGGRPGGQGTPAGPAGSTSGAGTGTASGSAGSGSIGSAGPSASVTVNPSSGSPSAGSTVSLGGGSRSGATIGVGSGSGSRSVSLGASTGQGSGATSVGVQVTGGSAGGSAGATVSAGVSVGSTSAGVTATVGSGNGPAGVGVGISIGGLPPIKIP